MVSRLESSRLATKPPASFLIHDVAICSRETLSALKAVPAIAAL